MTARVIDLRRAFDLGFAAALPPPAPAQRDFLWIRITGEPAAVPLCDVASLHADLPITALPTRAPELLGVAAIRAAIVPIYDLGAAVGGVASAAPRWAVLMSGRPAGFAFDGFDGHARAGDAAIASPAPATGEPERGFVRGRITLGGMPRPIIDLSAVLTAIESRWQSAGHRKG